MQAKSELEDMKNEHVREMEGLVDNIRQLERELARYTLIIDRFIPQSYQVINERSYFSAFILFLR